MTRNQVGNLHDHKVLPISTFNHCEGMKVMSKNTKIGEGVNFQRIRRVSGYCSPLYRWNTAKRCEERERVKHSLGCNCCK